MGRQERAAAAAGPRAPAQGPHTRAREMARGERASLPTHACALQVSQWTSSCLENCIKKLAGLNKPFKYVVTCVIMQKNGARRDAVRADFSPPSKP